MWWGTNKSEMNSMFNYFWSEAQELGFDEQQKNRPDDKQ